MSPRYETADVHSIFGNPDMSVLECGRRSPPALPSEMFGPVWPLLSELAADAGGAPVDYVALSVLTVAASLVGNKRWVRPFMESDYREPCIVWAAMVGDPSSGKSPAVSVATKPLPEIERRHAESHVQRLQTYEANLARSKAERSKWEDLIKAATKEGAATPALPAGAVEPVKPERRRTLVQDATPEALAQILAGNHQGTLHLRDELSGWLASFDRYSPGGRSFWLEAFGGRPFVIDRKGAAEPVIVPFNGVSVLGGVQPEKLADALLDGPDDGLVARFIWAWPEPGRFVRPTRLADAARLARLYDRLDGLRWGIGDTGQDVGVTLSLEPDAATLYEHWRGEDSAPGKHDEGGGLYKGLAGKLHGLVLRLALVGELICWADRGGDEPDAVTLDRMAAAIALCDDYIKPMAKRVFGDAALPPVERRAAALARAIIRNRSTQINARSVQREWRLPGFNSAAVVNEAIGALVEADWLHPLPSRSGSNPGRQRGDFAVNALVHGR